MSDDDDDDNKLVQLSSNNFSECINLWLHMNPETKSTQYWKVSDSGWTAVNHNYNFKNW